MPTRLIASGLLVAEADGIAEAFAAAGLREVDRRESGEWAALLLTSVLSFWFSQNGYSQRGQLAAAESCPRGPCPVPVQRGSCAHAASGGTRKEVDQMLNPLAIGVTVGGLLLDVVAPRPKPRAGLAFDEPSLLSPRAAPRTPKARPGSTNVVHVAGRPVRWGPRAQVRASSRTRRRRDARGTVSDHGLVRRQVPRVQGLSGRRDARARRVARRPATRRCRRTRPSCTSSTPAASPAKPRPSRASRSGARCEGRHAAGVRRRLRRQPARRAVRRDRPERAPVRRDRGGCRGCHRRRARRVRRPAARPARARARPAGRPHTRLRQGPGRLRLPLRVLHHPHGSRRRRGRGPRAPCSARCAGAWPRASPRW